jgi:cell division protein FtsW
VGVVLSLAREQMAPAMRPKKMLKFTARTGRDKKKPKNSRKRA